MTNWIKKFKFKKYRKILLNAFPEGLHNDVNVVLDILPFSENDVKLCNGKTHKVKDLIHDSNLQVILDGEILKIPYRLYFNEPNIEEENKLTDNQKTILNCILLRHHNGYLRQHRLEQLHDKNDYWTTPFKIQLLGEYVIEILMVLNSQLDNKSIANYRKFITENPTYWRLTESRMISYWDAYYRRPKFPKLNTYIGRQIVDEIKKANA